MFGGVEGRLSERGISVGDAGRLLKEESLFQTYITPKPQNNKNPQKKKKKKVAKIREGSGK